MALKTQTIRGVSSNLITGTASLFYNKVGSINKVATGFSWTATSKGFLWDTSADALTWLAGASTGTLVAESSFFTIADTTNTEYWEVPAFDEGTGTDSQSYAYTLEQAQAVAGSLLATTLAKYPKYTVGLGANKPYGTIGYTTNGMSITFTPEWGEIQVDQLLDAARIFKTGQTATLNTTIAEATLENLAIALAVPQTQYPKVDAGGSTGMELNAGNLYDCPVERSLVAIGPGRGGCATGQAVERVYTAYRALSQEAVTINMSRNDPQTYDVAFRLMPNDSGSYGRIVDRLILASTQNAPATPLTGWVEP